jgi:hypothetical protein
MLIALDPLIETSALRWIDAAKAAAGKERRQANGGVDGKKTDPAADGGWAAGGIPV